MNEARFTALIKQYTPLVFTICRRFVNDYQEAENLTQDTFLTAFQAIDRFVGDRYKPWLTRIAVNKCKDYLKSAYHQTTAPTEEETLDQYEDRRSGVSEEAERRETREWVRAACEQLQTPYREVALLHYLEDKSFAESAAILGRPIKTVETQGYRAREMLKKLLREGKPC